MRVLIPGAAKDPSRPQWWVASVDIHKRPSIGWVVDILVRLKWVSIQIQLNAAVDNPTVKFVRATRYTTVFTAHPNGGNAHRIKCEECGAEYPFPNASRGLMFPCAFCSVERETAVRLRWRPMISGWDEIDPSSTPYTRLKQWPKAPTPIEPPTSVYGECKAGPLPPGGKVDIRPVKPEVDTAWMRLREEHDKRRLDKLHANPKSNISKVTSKLESMTKDRAKETESEDGYDFKYCDEYLEDKL